MGFQRALVVASLLAASPAVAQPDIEMEGDAPPADTAPTDAPVDTPPADAPVVKDPKVAKKWLQAADTLVKKGDQLAKQNKADEAKVNYQNAVTAYQKAIEAGDDVTLKLPLAIAMDKAGDTPGAMVQLKALIGAQGIKPDLVKKAQTRLDEASMKVGVVMLAITPEGTQISIAGKQVGESPMAEPLVLMPGTHTVSFTAVGYQPKEVELKIEAGSESERKISLEPVQMTTKPDDSFDTSEPAVVTAPTKPSMVPLYVGGGATVMFLTVATITGIAAVSKAGAYEDSVSETERSDIRGTGKSLALVTDLCILGAVGAAAFTSYWYMYKYRPQARALAEREQQARGPKVDVVPWVQLDAGGISAIGSF